MALLIGVSLGLIGSGGSILSVPILVYFFGVTPEVATTHSLFIVGITAITASYKHYRIGNLKTGLALQFGLPSVIILLLTRKYILPTLPEQIIQIGRLMVTRHLLLMGLFAILMIAAAAYMIRKTAPRSGGRPSHISLMIIAVGVGLVTGLLGAGGGFLIVPALLIYGRLELKYAIATSLTIITFNSLIGFTGDLINGVQFNKMLLLKVSLMALTGLGLGIGLSRRMNGEKLKPLFGWFILIMGIFIIIREFVF
ncbi:sulfite exporter TauE/SafE family protein [Niabella terrae]